MLLLQMVIKTYEGGLNHTALKLEQHTSMVTTKGLSAAIKHMAEYKKVFDRRYANVGLRVTFTLLSVSEIPHLSADEIGEMNMENVDQLPTMPEGFES